ncbi:CopG family transcriptional regulator [Halobacteriales archaeon QH_6_64_20]|nr:MAG: CopG family transcriptional regulator [Halobacteriales archaeon QH_6_64_20]
MPKISVEVPGELLADLDTHVGSDGKFVNRSEAIRASIRKTLDLLDEIDDRHSRLEPEPRSADGDRPESGGENDRDAHEDDGVRNGE